MAKVVGEIAVQVGADVSKLQSGMKKGAAAVEGFDDKAKKMALNVAKAGAAIATAMAAATAAILKMASEAAATGREIQNLSDIAGVSTTEFQRLSIASETVGVSQEKLADIFKDVNDKFGDYMATGAGPLADFFENIAPKIGITATEFANLSGPDALQLYVTSLEKAGVSQQQMTFYMEALASDATALVPLLANSGRAFADLGDEAERAGRIMSQDAIDAAVELDRELTAMTDTLKTQATEAILEYKDEILAAAEYITGTLIPAMGSIAQSAIDFAISLKPAIDALSTFISLASAAAGIGSGGAPAEVSAEQAAINAANDAAFFDPQREVSSSGSWPLDENGNVIMDDGSLLETANPKPTPVVNPGSKPSDTDTRRRPSGGRSGGGGASRGPDRDDFDRLMEQYATEQEQLEIHLAEQLEKLEEYRVAKLGTEQEYNELEAQIKKEHLDDLAALEAAAAQARLQDIGSAFGDLSSLMVSENAKVFKIGQAAAIAEATISGYQAAVDAWQKGMKIGGPPVAAAFAGASIIKTGALISQISSASPSGGGGGASMGGAPSAAGAAGGSQGPLDVRMTGLGMNDIVRGSDVANLLDMLTEESGDRGYRLSFAQ